MSDPDQIRADIEETRRRLDVDVDALQEQVVAAVAGGGAFVRFEPIGRGEIAVLVTQRTPVRFEIEEHSDAEVARWTEAPPRIDLAEVFPDIALG